MSNDQKYVQTTHQLTKGTRQPDVTYNHQFAQCNGKLKTCATKIFVGWNEKWGLQSQPYLGNAL